jgi:hypothetical protein
MSVTTSLDYQINRLGFWSIIIAFATGVISAFLPLDAPGGYAAEHTERVAWLSANAGAFIAAWVNQIAAMLSLSCLFFAIAWKVAGNNPLSAILAAMVVLLSVVAFIIPKFMAVWTIPVLANTITTGAIGAEMADSLLMVLNVSIPFSLYTSFDYLGFWLYSLFALLVAVPLFGQSKTAKVTAVSLGIFGVTYQLIMSIFLFGEIAPTEIEVYFGGTVLLLPVVMVAMLINFKAAMASRA